MKDLNCLKGENYWPCQCGREFWSFSVTCKSITTTQVAEIFKTPNKTVEMYSFHFNGTTTLGSVHIPANFLSYRTLQWRLTLECPSRINDKNEIEQVPITIDPNAFTSSSESLKHFQICNCNLGRFNFSFLTGFDRLMSVIIENPTNIEKANWNSLSSLLALDELEIIIDNKEFIQNNWNEWALQLPPLNKELKKFVCHGGVDDEAADRLAQWLLNSSATILEHLEFRETKLTRIPPGISNFENLVSHLIISCKDSEIKVLAENSIKLNFVIPSEIEISNCGIRELQSGAIQGNNLSFTSYNINPCYILKMIEYFFYIGNLSSKRLRLHLNNNNLTRLEWRYFESYFTEPSFLRYDSYFSLLDSRAHFIYQLHKKKFLPFFQL